jgi:excisionase family DNA binding protein
VVEHPEARPEPAKEVPTMEAYATAEALPRAVVRSVPGAIRRSDASKGDDFDTALLDGLLGRLADLVVERLRERAETEDQPRQWMDARDAAAYLGVHRDTVRKLAAEGAIPVHQDGPGSRLYFRRAELDEWRLTAKPQRRRQTTLRPVS